MRYTGDLFIQTNILETTTTLLLLLLVCSLFHQKEFIHLGFVLPIQQVQHSPFLLLHYSESELIEFDHKPM